MKSLTKGLFILFLASTAFAQQKFKAATVAFYNVENLFDTEESIGLIDGTKDEQNQFYHVSYPLSQKDSLEASKCACKLTVENLKGKKTLRELILIEEFTPEGPKAWDQKRYNKKIQKMGRVIADIGRDVTKEAPVAIGLVEVENRKVVEDLAQAEALQPYHYGVVHYNSLDKRGIDCALLYQKDRFTPTETHKYELEIYNPDGKRDYTRDILRVSGLLDGEEVHFLVNHWPSRRGGEAASAPKRKAAGELLRSIFEELWAQNPKAKIMAMGDFNDDPVSASIKKWVGTQANKKKLKEKSIFNPMEKMYKKGFGTLAYRDGWNLFDQVLLSSALVGKDYKTYELFRAEIFSPSYLISKEGPYKGYPNRTYGGSTYHEDGYSDHFPVYAIFLKKF